MDVVTLRTLRYCKMSGIDIKRRTLRNLRPDKLKLNHSTDC